MNEPVLGPSANESTQVNRKKTDRQTAIQQDMDLRNVMGTTSGRRFVARLFDEAKLHGSTYWPGATFDQVAFYAGRRSLASWVFGELDSKCPDLYDMMVREARASQRETERADDSTRS